ncbi:MAG: isoprenyl transferase [Paludibacteraceae bacterium]|nr:isoprenyl transferase [Paludibacteraceae bacterium]MBP5481489.1 isoprenyl transferase [Paludibacteraceae bacterium]
MDLKEQIDVNRIPQHVAIIMDGNGRWAKSKGLDRIFGHREGVDSVDKVMEAASDLGVKYITLYAFSTENWNRPEMEVNALMEILSEALKKYIEKISKNNVRLLVIGDKSRLSKLTLSNLSEAEKMTEKNTGLTMVLAISYSSRWEIVEATKQIASEVKSGSLSVDAIDEKIFSNHLATAGIPDPDLLIRTSGELRISNFLMWQLSYSELYFTPVSWPEFKKEQFFEAIIDYQKRERRFGKTSEQLS